MPYNHLAILAQIDRLGRAAQVYSRSDGEDGELRNSFGQLNSDYTLVTDGDGNAVEVLCLRTYPSQNEYQRNTSGDRNSDEPLFVFPFEDAPETDARIEYPEPDNTTTLYQLKAPTRYDTHVEFPAEVVTNQ
jgi:hypothetical protein